MIKRLRHFQYPESNMTNLKSKTLLLFLVIFLAGCESTIAPEIRPELTFQHLQPISLNIVDIQFVRGTTNDAIKPKDVAFKFPVTPEAALFGWAKSRLRVAGLTGTARFVIHQDSVTETSVKIDRGIGGLFKKQISEKYDAVVEASLEIYDSRNIRRAFATAQAKETITVREDASLADRQRLWLALVERLLASFDKRMEENIQRHMIRYLR